MVEPDLAEQLLRGFAAHTKTDQLTINQLHAFRIDGVVHMYFKSGHSSVESSRFGSALYQLLSGHKGRSLPPGRIDELADELLERGHIEVWILADRQFCVQTGEPGKEVRSIAATFEETLARAAEGRYSCWLGGCVLDMNHYEPHKAVLPKLQSELDYAAWVAEQRLESKRATVNLLRGFGPEGVKRSQLMGAGRQQGIDDLNALLHELQYRDKLIEDVPRKPGHLRVIADG